jgi:lysophospholipase L1-like esterase
MKTRLPVASARLLTVASLIILTMAGSIPTTAQGGDTAEWELLGFSGDGVLSIAFSPNYVNDDTIFAGTYDGTASYLYQSTDRGDSWTADPDWSGTIRAIVFSPDYANDHTLFASAGSAAFTRRSTDGGDTWTDVGPASETVCSMVVSPDYANDRTLFAGTNSGHVFRSVDGGDTWVDTGLILSGGYAVRALAISPNYTNDHTIFAGMGRAWDWYRGGMYRSTDGGNTWTPISNGLTYKEVWAVAISPNFSGDQTLFLTVWGGGVYRSTNSGNSWVEANGDQPNRRPGNGPSLVFSPDYASDQTVFYGTWGEYHDGGVYRSTDAGASWSILNVGLSTRWIHALAVPPNYNTNPKLLAGGELVNGGGLWIYPSLEKKPEIDYFALGDSIASGHGLMDDGSACHQSSEAYPHKVKELLKARYEQVNFQFLACSGATALYDEGKVVEHNFKWLGNQVDAVLGNLSNRPTLVSITIGANDFQWSEPLNFSKRLLQPSDAYLRWVQQKKTMVGTELKYHVQRLLAHPNVAVVITEVHNPVNMRSRLFFNVPGRSCDAVWGLLTCYEKIEYGVILLNSAFWIDVWEGLGFPDRLQITGGLGYAFAGHASPQPACGEAPPPASETWIQYPGDPQANSHLPKILKRLWGIGDDTAGDCFHPNRYGALFYASRVDQAAQSVGR